MTQIIESTNEWISLRTSVKDKTFGLVPTMGALHAGHLELVKRSMRENDLTVVSIFVNPTQFNDPKDFEKYPVQVEKDVALLEELGVQYVFLPNYDEMYADQYRYQVTEKEFSQTLCGAHRPGHFDGVLTIVLKLLNLAQANKAYFGEKDFQQLTLIQGMVRSFFISTQIIACPIVRESDGLAMSSRNIRLSSLARKKSAMFPKILNEASSCEDARLQLLEQGFIVDYIEEHSNRRLGAIRIEDVRLIDNVQR